MKKIDDIAYIYATMMNSDDKIATTELESWYKMVEKRWPEIPKENAGSILKNTLYRLKSQNELERKNQIDQVLLGLKQNLKKLEIDNLAKDLTLLIQADEKISMGEISLAGLLKWKLGLNINFE